MSPPAEPSFVTALAALAELLPEAGPRTLHRALGESASGLDPKEQDALQTFEAAGWECIKKLGTDTLVAVRSAAKVLAAADEGLAEQGPDGGTQQDGSNSVRQMFKQFDVHGTGRLGQEEFKEMLVTLGLTEHFSDAELSTLMGAADTQNDGSVDLHEFTKWLYAGMGVGQEDSEDTEAAVGGEQARMEENLRKQLCSTRSALETAEKELLDAKRAHTAAMRRAEETAEEELETLTQFWRAVAEASAVDRLGGAVDMGAASLLGHGKYGYVLKSKRLSDGVNIVMKLLSLRWAHVAATEWGKARAAAEHPNLVEYTDVLLHADEDKAIQRILAEAREAGRLQTRVRRDNFPSHYVCLMQEFMNAGTVQDWIDTDLLLPGGLISVVQTVASALSHLHACGLTHNDIKPENILLSQEDEAKSCSPVTVKLADLGLAKRSTDRTDDFWQYGMTLLCMATGEKFGQRKYQAAHHDEYVKVMADCVSGAPQAESGAGGAVFAALVKLPGLLKRVFDHDVTMREISGMRIFQGWSFFDGEVLAEPEAEATEAQASATQVQASASAPATDAKKKKSKPSRASIGGPRSQTISEEDLLAIRKLSARRKSRLPGDLPQGIQEELLH